MATHNPMDPAIKAMSITDLSKKLMERVWFSACKNEVEIAGPGVKKT
jgi:hypothetical protein